MILSTSFEEKLGKKTYKGIDIAHALRVVRVSEVRNLLPALLHSRGGERGVGTEYGTLAALPPDLRNETCADLKDFSDRKSTRLNSSHSGESRMPSSA